MSGIDLIGTSAALDKIKSSWGEGDSVSSVQPFPQIRLTTINRGVLSGISFKGDQISKPIEYKNDIFSELPGKTFDEKNNQQMVRVMKAFRNQFYRCVSEYHGDTVIPKLEYSFNEEEEAELLRMTSQWDSGNAMLYFSFEKDPMESSFGMLWNDNKSKNYQTRSGSLYFNKIDDVIQEIIEFIIRVYNI